MSIEDYNEGVMHVLDTLGMSEKVFSQILETKLEGNKGFILSIKYVDIAPDTFVDTEFLEADLHSSIDDNSDPAIGTSNETKGVTGMTAYGFLGGCLSESTGVGFSPDGDVLYTCPHCPGLHRKYEECPTPQYDTGDPWNSPSDGNPPLKK